MAEFETKISSKGQVVIAKEIREELGVKTGQKFAEEISGGKILLKPLPALSEFRGSLKHVAKKKSISEISRWIDKGWE